MKKPVIAAIALAAASAVSIGAFAFLKNKNENEEKLKAESSADNKIFSFDSDAINRISISSSDGDFSLVLDGDIWVNDESSGNSFSVNQTTAQGLCTVISSLSAPTNYGKATDDSKAKYGLTDPYTVTVSDGSTSYTVNIGDISPTGNYYYATVEGKKNIYALISSDAESLIATRFELIDNDLLPYSDTDVSQMTLKKDGNVVFDLTLNKETGRWELPPEYDMLTVNQTRPDSIVTVLTRLTAVQMVEENLTDLSKYGFDKPYAEFIVKGFDGSERTLLLSRYGRDSSTFIHVFLKDTGMVETYYTGDFAFADYSIFNLIMQTVESANIYDVVAFDFKCDEAEDSFTVDHDAAVASFRGSEIDLSKAEVFSIFETFYNFFSYISLTDIDLEAKPELKDAVLSANYVRSDGTEMSIDLVSTGKDQECYVFYNGEYTGTKTVADFISGPNSMISTYKIVCQRAGLEPNSK